MTSLPRLIIEAATAGGFEVVAVRIQGLCGAIDTAKRLIALNPDCTDEQIEAEIGDQLRVLASTEEPPHVEGPPPARPPLALVHSADRLPTGSQKDSPNGSGSQVVG